MTWPTRSPPPAGRWKDATWAGTRLLQLRAFQALSLREKVLALEEMERVPEALRIPHPHRG
jgi:hypothetical protein